MKIIFYPFENKANRYIDNQKKALTDLGHELVCCKRLIRAGSDVDIAFLQWYEGINVKNRVKSFLIFFYKVAELNHLKRKKIKIVTVFNNRAPHDTRGINLWLSTNMIRHLLRVSDRILVMTEYAKPYLADYIREKDAGKVFVYPHPNYIAEGSLNQNASTDLKGPDDRDTFVVSYTGLIRPYKNIELLIDVARKLRDLPIRFVIAGLAFDKEYANRLLASAAGLDHVTVREGLLTDEELNTLICSSDIQVFPFAKGSMIHSGSIIQAFSCARTVICPMIPALMDFPENCTYGYDYQDPEEHSDVLMKQILNAYSDWKNSRERFEEKGTRLFEIVKNENSIEKVSEAFDRILTGLNE